MNVTSGVTWAVLRFAALGPALLLVNCGQDARTAPGTPAKVEAAEAAAPASPTVVELFQSQGCSSCPPANANLNAIADRDDVIALSFAVTYWDRLGWRDTFASPVFTQRQWDYANAGSRHQVSTPQVIVNGRDVLVGNDGAELDQRIAANRLESGPDIEVENGRVTVAGASGAPAATVWLVRYDPRVHDVPIRAGENGGRTLPHKNIVRHLDRLGDWTGSSVSYAIPASPDLAYRSAVIVQQGPGGPIIASRRIMR